MKWTKKKALEVEANSKVEIVAHKRATKREVAKVQKANDALKKVFEDNHFTVKLVLASKEK